MGGDEDNGLSAGAIYDVDRIPADIVFVPTGTGQEYICDALKLSFRSAWKGTEHKHAFILCDLDTGNELVVKADLYHGGEETEVTLILPLRDAYSLGAKNYSRVAIKAILDAGLTAFCQDLKIKAAGDPFKDAPTFNYAWGGIRFEPPEPSAVMSSPTAPVNALAATVKAKRRLPIIKWLLMTVGGLVAFSIVQVCVYRFVPVPVTILMIERLVQGNGLDHRWVSASDISDNLKSAVIAAEDAKFCTHDGFDYEAIKKAERYNATHRKKRGASTISQQTAKNVFLWPSRDWVRKGFEVWYTFLIEHLWTKDRIMEVYLNSVEWGRGVYGAEAASQYWFHHSAKALSPAEASKLAAILPDPDKWKAVGSGHYVTRRSGSIQARARSATDGCTVD
jgi:monofunctional biosynthetic peptidoglycan transglycosylase